MGGKRVKDEEQTKKQKEREHSKRGKDQQLFPFIILINLIGLKMTKNLKND